jgi:hypothetical protein
MKTLDEKISDRIDELKSQAKVRYSEEEMVLWQLTPSQLEELEAIIACHFPRRVPQGTPDWDRMVDLLSAALERRNLLR